MDDEAVAQFVAVTGAPANRAEQYMQLSDGNVEQAIQLWYETGGIDMMESTTAASTSQVPPVPTLTKPHPDVVNLDSDEEGGDVEYVGERAQSSGGSRPVPNHLEEDDEAMARRLQEEIYGGDIPQERDSDGVRAPIARTTETLVGPEPYDFRNPSDRAAAVAEQMLLRQQRGMPDSRRILEQARTASGLGPASRPGGLGPSIWDQSEDFSSQMQARAERGSGEESEASRKATRLTEMFRPPFELMSRLSWDDARDDGKENEKWILVNVQDPSIFDCQLLNRDIWKHDGIKETVQEHFIFLQYNKDDPRGSQYMQYYFPHRDAESAYPHIAIVDPRTGERVKVWSGPPAPKAMDFLMQLHEFLDRYSLHAKAKNPVARRKPDPPPQVSRIDTMTEEEQLELAVQASLAQGEAGPSRAAAAADPDDLTRSLTDLKADTADAASRTARVPRGDTPMAEAPPAEPNNLATPPPESSANPTFAAIPSDRPHTEPAASEPGTTRIQFRHPEGRVVRRFLLSDPVERLYEWLKAEPLPGIEGKEFALSFMGRNLLADVQEGKSLEGAGLRNGSVNVEVVEGE